MDGGRRLTLAVGWFLLIAWLGVVVYIRGTDRWGAFAVAPLLLPLLLASAGVALVGALLWIALARRGRLDGHLALVSLLNAAIFWLASTKR